MVNFVSNRRGCSKCAFASGSGLTGGESATECEDCGVDIPEARRLAVPGVFRCIVCQEAVDAAEGSLTSYNRRGNKDSQLR